jgi:hypothetical protein
MYALIVLDTFAENKFIVILIKKKSNKKCHSEPFGSAQDKLREES